MDITRARYRTPVGLFMNTPSKKVPLEAKQSTPPRIQERLTVESRESNSNKRINRTIEVKKLEALMHTVLLFLFLLGVKNH